MSRRSHPAPELLALAARGDVSWFRRPSLRLHLMRCAACRHEVAQFASAIAELKREAATETLTAFEAIADWDRLEREMLGNVVVGLAAARCIENFGRKRGWISSVAIGAALLLLFIAGWMTHIPRKETTELAHAFSQFAGFHPAAPKPGEIVRTTASGIAVRSGGVTLTLLHPPGAVVSVSGKSSLEARYVDADTGQLTITSVYGQ